MDNLAKQIDEFAENIRKGSEFYLKAAKTYAGSVDSYGARAETAYRRRFPDATEHSWSLFLRVGRGELTVAVFFCGSDKVVDVVSRLPIKDQVRLLGDGTNAPKPVKVLTRGRIVEKPVSKMSPSQIFRLVDLDRGKIRTLSEQKDKAEEDKAAYEERQETGYRVGYNKLTVIRPMIFDIKELENILRKMRRHA